MRAKRPSLAYTIGYVVVLGAVCAGLLTAANRALAPYREANEQAAEIRDILTALGVPFPEGAGAQQLQALFEQAVRKETRGNLAFYLSTDPAGRTQAVAVGFAGKGLWGPISGWLALEPDRKTIRAITFQAPDETPGIGGEITKPAFRDQFKGKVILAADGTPGIRITRGDGPTGPNEVHGVSGATLTSDKVQEMLNARIREIAGTAEDP